MSRFDDVRSIVRSLGPATYRNADRVVNDAIACLQNVPFLEPKALQMTRNDGSTSTLLALDGTIQTYYGGASYQTPVCIYIPEPYPDYPPIAYLRPTREMFVVPGHRFADANGLVYLPYLSEWRPMYSNIVELIGVMVSVFSEMPPLRSRPPEMGLGPAVGPAQNPYPITAASGIAPGPVGAINGPPRAGMPQYPPGMPQQQQQQQWPPQPQQQQQPPGMPQLNPFGIPMPGSSGPGPMPQYPPAGSAGGGGMGVGGPMGGAAAGGGGRAMGGPGVAAAAAATVGIAAGGAALAGAAAGSSLSSPSGSSSATADNNAKRQQLLTPKDEKAEKIREITAYLQSKLADMLRQTGRHMDQQAAAQEQLEKRGTKGKTLIEETKKGVKELEAYQAALDKQIAELQQWLANNEKVQLQHVRGPSTTLGGNLLSPTGGDATTAPLPSVSSRRSSLATSDSGGAGGFSTNRPPSLDTSSIDGSGSSTHSRPSAVVVAFEDVAVASSKLQQQLLEAVAEDSAIEDSYFYLDQLLADGKIDLRTMLVEVRELSRKQFRARYLARKIDGMLAADRRQKLGASTGSHSGAGAGAGATLARQQSMAGGAMGVAAGIRPMPQQQQQQPYYPAIGR